MIQFMNGNALNIPLADGSVQCVITSPPYWGLRDYGTATWEGGDEGCDHIAIKKANLESGLRNDGRKHKGLYENEKAVEIVQQYKDTCGKCGATRIDAQLGLERTPEEYVANMVQVFREVKRVLRDDGSLWLVIGDSYWNSNGFARADAEWQRKGRNNAPANDRKLPPHDILKVKDLVGIPWRVAFALQADGWWLRQWIPWIKRNSMPESCEDRPPSACEFVFQFSKSKEYYYDYIAIKRPTRNWRNSDAILSEDGRIIVLDVPTSQYRQAHFATYPGALVEPLILVGTSEKGCCPKCHTPWKRVVEKSKAPDSVYTGSSKPVEINAIGDHTVGMGQKYNDWLTEHPPTTLGWQPGCFCGTEHPIPKEELDADPTLLDDFEIEPFDPVPCLVLDPFAGSGTTGLVATKFNRDFIGLDLSMEYIDLALKRTSGVQRVLM